MGQTIVIPAKPVSTPHLNRYLGCIIGEAAGDANGYNPINQLVGYILSEDPPFITSKGNARSLMTRIDRDELLQELLKYYLEE